MRRPGWSSQRGAALLVCALVGAGCGPSYDPRGFAVQLRLPASYEPEALASLEVQLEGPGGVRVTARTDAQGVARFRDLADGAYTLRAALAVDAARAAVLTGHAVAHELRAERREGLTVPTTAERYEVDLELAGPPLGGPVLREVYYAGAPGLGGNHYFHDQFVEVYNNGTAPVALRGLCVGDVYGPAGAINPGTRPSPYAARDPMHVLVENLWRFPDESPPRVLAPGERVVLAHDGTNHQPDSALDLSDADYEAFNLRDDERDRDWPMVPNLERVLFNGGFDWLLPVFGASVVLVRCDDEPSWERVTVSGLPGPRLRVPVAAVLDGIDALQNADSAAFKRLPGAVDAGFAFVSGTYTGESVRRRPRARVAGRVVYEDTNDSARDLEVAATPTPRGP